MRKSDNVIFQERETSLLAALAKNPDLISPADITPKFLHVVSPFACAAGSEADYVQRLAFQTMARAKIAYEALNAPGKIEHLAACFEEDRDYALLSFNVASLLKASALDFDFRVPKKLPLLFDILDAAKLHASDDSYVVFTNTDICLTVGFYDTIASFLRLGFDALVVNRRTIEKFPPGLAAVANASLGMYHPGYDCFVLKASLLKMFIRTAAIIGRSGVMQSLVANMVAYAQRLLVLRDVHLTYHLGDDRTWHTPENADYNAHNEAELYKMMAACGPTGQERLRQCGFKI